MTRGDPPDERIRLGVGDLVCFLDGADVRDLTIGGRRVLNRLYLAVRDESWNTVPFRRSEPMISRRDGAFEVRMDCTVDAAPIRAELTIVIAGESPGSLEYTIEGQMSGSFRYAKLGLNLHHPLPECLGARYVASRGAATGTGRIPTLVEPQLVVDGRLTAMFMPYDQLLLETEPGEKTLFRFSGDEFEMQDHRNWTDYNLKSYGTPLSVPLPLVAEPGERIFQSVRVELRLPPGEARAKPIEEPDSTVRIDRTRLSVLPRLGSELADELPLEGRAVVDSIRQIGLDYVRVNLDVTSEEALRVGSSRLRQVSSWELPIELVLVVSAADVDKAELARLRSVLAETRPKLERVVVLEGPRGFTIGRTATAGSKVRAFRAVVEEQVGPIGLVAATEQFFAELSRDWPELEGVDGVAYTICPQVHAADDASLMENSWGQVDTVLTARARTGGRPVHVLSLALIGKFGPYPGGVPEVDDRMTYGDPRQHTLFGAAWTVSSLSQLVLAGAASATYFELLGERGLLRTGPTPGPICRVIEAVAHWEGGNLVRVVAEPGDPIVGLGTEWAARSAYLVANLTPFSRQLDLSALPGRVDVVRDLEMSGSGASWRTRAALNPVGSMPRTVIGPYGVVGIGTVEP